MSHQILLVLDFGSQYTQLIARRLRELNVYTEVVSYRTPTEELASRQPAGLILSGGPSSVSDPGAPRCAKDLFSLGIPVLGICYGMQLMADMLGGSVEPASQREFGHATIRTEADSPLFKALPADIRVWASHGDRLGQIPPAFARSRQVPMRRLRRWRIRRDGSMRCCSIRRWSIPSAAWMSSGTSPLQSAGVQAIGR